MSDVLRIRLVSGAERQGEGLRRRSGVTRTWAQGGGGVMAPERRNQEGNLPGCLTTKIFPVAPSNRED